MIDLDAIEARIRDCKTYNFGLWNADKLAHEDAPAMLNELRHLRVIASGNQGAIVNSIIERTRHEATGDEREALAINYCPEHGDLLNRPDGTDARSHRCRNAHEIDEIHARFRRSEVPEPSAECPKCGVRATGQTPSTFYTHHDETCDGALEEPQGEPSFEVPEPSTDARCCAHVKCPSGSLCCCIDEAPGASACVCLPAIAGISDGPNVDCPEHGERLDVAVLREAWVHYTAVGASVEVQEQKAAVFDRWIAGPRVEPSCDYEAGYAEGFHHGVSTPRGSAENDREQGEPSDALPPLWRCPSCPVILVGPQIDGEREHTLEHESENP